MAAHRWEKVPRTKLAEAYPLNLAALAADLLAEAISLRRAARAEGRATPMAASGPYGDGRSTEVTAHVPSVDPPLPSPSGSDELEGGPWPPLPTDQDQTVAYGNGATVGMSLAQT